MIESRSRFFRRYELRFSSRSKAGYSLPVVAPAGKISVVDALRLAARKQHCIEVQPNGDTVDLVRIDDSISGLLVLLFHRASPSAADPAYRKLKGQDITIRKTKKEVDEDQAVSAHLVISTNPSISGGFASALEEIPGLSLSVISGIIKNALDSYKYPYKDKKGIEKETYSTYKAFGVKGESLTAALKNNSSINYLTLTRTSIPDAPDSDGIAEPQSERIRYRIVGDPSSPEWIKKLAVFKAKIRSEDWDDILLDISLDDDRHRTVKLDRESEASEIMFVRAEQVKLSKDIDPCTVEIVPDLVDAAKKLLEKS